MDLSRVDRVQTGQQTRKFSRFAEKHRSVSGHSLSLIYGEWGHHCRAFCSFFSPFRQLSVDVRRSNDESSVG